MLSLLKEGRLRALEREALDDIAPDDTVRGNSAQEGAMPAREGEALEKALSPHAVVVVVADPLSHLVVALAKRETRNVMPTKRQANALVETSVCGTMVTSVVIVPPVPVLTADEAPVPSLRKVRTPQGDYAFTLQRETVALVTNAMTCTHLPTLPLSLIHI